MTAEPRRNDSLAYWIDRAGCSYADLATALARTARDLGHHGVRPDRSRISRWVNDGEQPRAPLPDVLAATLTRLCRLPGPLTREDLGMGARHGRRPPRAWAADAVAAAIITTTRSDAMTDDAAPRSSRPLTGPALMEAVQPWLLLPDPPLPARTGGRLGMSDVARIQATTEAFRRLDNAHGGGLSRLAVVGQLQEVTRMAADGWSTEATGRALWAAIAELASVAGWATHDKGLHAEAQTYLLHGLDAAKQAGPDGVGIAGHILNCLARQANHLNRADEALDLVQAALYGTRKLPPGRLRALLSTLEARCHAVLGDLPATSRSIGAAQDALAAEAGQAPPWARWFDAAEYHVTVGVCELIAAEHDPGRAERAVDLISTGTAQRPEDRTRSRAFDQIALARAHTRGGHLDAADQTTATALELIGRVDSTRVTDRLHELDHDLSTAPTSTHATSARDRIRAALPPAA